MKINVIFFSVFFLFLSGSIQAQGCSDAGFCTIGNLAAHKNDTALHSRHQIKLLLTAGQGDEDVFVFSPAIEYNINLSKQWSVQGKLAANYASGNLGSAIALSDAFLSGTYLFNPAAKWKTSATLGTKLPLDRGDLKEGDRSLPMQYQSSLGTVDLVAGLSIASKCWQFAAGWQQPLTGSNQNNFLPIYWDNPSASKYPSSRYFHRKGDVLLRSAYTFFINEKLSLNGGLLGIYHLGDDSYADDISEEQIFIRGSKGLTLNATAVASYRVNNKFNIGFSGGIPLIVRDVRPDGLTRRFVFSPEISIRF